MTPANAAAEPLSAPSEWMAAISRYRASSTWLAIWQLLNTAPPYIALWCFMPWLASISWWLAVPAAALAAGLQVRLFIMFHDCGHGSFFRSQRANRIIGFIFGVLTFVPSQQWWADHARHHATSGNLDRRGTGDVWTLTVQEYLLASRWRRLAYRLARNPFILFVLAPLFLFVVLQRFPTRGASARERASVHLTTLGIILMGWALTSAMGFTTYLILQGLVLTISGTAGVWLFYVQHQFEGVYWERGKHWNYAAAALHGSSFYKLPKILQWFSGNIGFHHIHHLSPGVPNYHLERCHGASPAFSRVPSLTLLSSLKSLRHRLWDEGGRRLVGYPRRG